MQKTSGERRVLVVEKETSTPAEVAAVLDAKPIDMEFEAEYVQNMRFAIACTMAEKVYTAFGTASRESEAKREVSNSTGKAFVEEHRVVVVGHIVAEQKGNLVAGR